MISTQSRLVARKREDFEAGRAQLRMQAYHLGVVRVRLASVRFESQEMAPGKRALIRNAALRRFEASPD